jgi:hypothetical protein
MGSKAFVMAALMASVAVVPGTRAAADFADGLVGGLVGGAVSGIIVNEGAKARERKRGTTTTTKRTVTRQAPSLNSQYSPSERLQIQTALNNRGFNVGAVDGILGKGSRAGIRAFQASLGEPQTGQLTAAQFAALTSPAASGANQAAFGVSNRALQANEVMLLQQSLWQMGFFQGTVDGVYSPATQVASVNFLTSQNRSPAQTTRVQTLVLAAASAGQMVPQYLIDEANAQQAAIQQNNGFGSTQASQKQPANTLFGSSRQPQTQPAAQEQPLFGPAPEQVAPGGGASGSESLFGEAPTQQPQQQRQLEQQPEAAGELVLAPQPAGTQDATQGTVVSTMGAGAQGAGQVQPASAQTGQSLDIFSGID